MCNGRVGDIMEPVDSSMVDGDPRIFKATSYGYGSPFNTTTAAVGLMVWTPGLFGSVRLPYDVVRLA